MTHTCSGSISALVQIMVCRMFDAKPLPEPMLINCELHPKEQTSVKSESKTEIWIQEHWFDNLKNEICSFVAIS